MNQNKQNPEHFAPIAKCPFEEEETRNDPSNLRLVDGWDGTGQMNKAGGQHFLDVSREA